MSFMTDLNIAVAKAAADLKKKPKEERLAFFVKCGIFDKNGQLAKKYRSEQNSVGRTKKTASGPR